jgi:hypothetical protein
MARDLGSALEIYRLETLVRRSGFRLREPDKTNQTQGAYVIWELKTPCRNRRKPALVGPLHHSTRDDTEQNYRLGTTAAGSDPV